MLGWVGSGNNFRRLGWVQKFWTWVGLGFRKLTPRPTLTTCCFATATRMITTGAYLSITGLCSASSTCNMTLPAFAAERRAAAPLLLGARRCRSICPACTALSSKPAARRCCGRMMGQTDRRTDGHRTVTRTLIRILRGYYQ